MEGTAYLGQRFAVVVVGFPGRQVAADGLQDLAGLLDEDLAQFLVHRFLVGRRWQQADRNVLRRRVDRLHRRSHHLGQRQGRRFAGERLGGRRRLGLSPGNCTSGRSRSERSSSSRLEPSQADTSPSASGKATSSGSGSSASRTSSCSAEPSKAPAPATARGFPAARRRTAPAPPGSDPTSRRPAPAAPGHRRAPLLRQRPVRQAAGPEAGAASAGRSRPERSISSRLKSSRLRAGAGVDCGWPLSRPPPATPAALRRNRPAAGPGPGRGTARRRRARLRQGPVVVAGQQRGIFLAASAGAVSAGGCSAVSATSTTASGLRLGSRGLDGSGPGQAGLGRGRRIRFQRIAEVRQAVLGDVEDQVALAGMVPAQALQVILDAGDGIGQGIQGSASPAPPCAPAAVPGYSGCRFPAGSRRAPAGSSPGRRGPGSAAPARGPGARGSTARR